MNEQSPQPEDVSDFYDVYTHVLLRAWGDNFHYGYWLSDDDDTPADVAAERLTDLLVERIALRPGDRMLDVGCGVGVPAIRLAEAVDAEIVGISINRAQVLAANERARTAGVADRVRFEHANAMALPYPDDSFDAVWAFESLLHMERKLALHEMARVLRPGGRLVLADVCQRAPLSPEHRATLEDALAKFALAPLPSIQDYTAMVADAGLAVAEVLDISEQTKRTVHRVAAGALEHRAELEHQHGEAARQLIEVLLHPISTLPEYGYLVVTATR